MKCFKILAIITISVFVLVADVKILSSSASINEISKPSEVSEEIKNYKKIQGNSIVLAKTIENDQAEENEAQEPEETVVENEGTSEELATAIQESNYIVSRSMGSSNSYSEVTTEPVIEVTPEPVQETTSIQESEPTAQSQEEPIHEEQPIQESEPEPQAPESSSSGSAIVETAMNYLGCSYVSGGTSPSGFDCSGFTQYVYGLHGIHIARVAADQAAYGTYVEKSDLQPGDLLLFGYYGSSSIGHAGIYIGNGQMIHAANSNRGVVIDTIESGYYYNNYITARRLQ